MAHKDETANFPDIEIASPSPDGPPRTGARGQITTLSDCPEMIPNERGALSKRMSARRHSNSRPASQNSHRISDDEGVTINEKLSQSGIQNVIMANMDKSLKKYSERDGVDRDAHLNVTT